MGRRLAAARARARWLQGQLVVEQHAGEQAGCEAEGGKPGGPTPLQLVGKEGPPKDGVFKWVGGGPRYLDPNKVSETAGHEVAMQMFEGLLTHDIKTGPPVPGVATHFKVSPDGKTYTFYLRKNAKWSNGRTVTARDFEYSWKRALSPEFISENAELLWQFIEGAHAYKKGKNKDWSSVGVKVIDDYTIEVRLKNPTPFFPELAAYIAYAPIPREAVEKHGALWTRPENIIVNGPYKMTYYKHRDKITLVKNPLYWDAKHTRILKYDYIHSESETQSFEMYNLGTVHYIPSLVPVEMMPKLKAQGRPDLHIDPYMCVYYYVFNTKKKPFDNVDVRRAINMAINKDELVTNLLQGGQLPASNLVPHMFKKTMGYKSPKGDYFDPGKAKKLLQRSGVKLEKLDLIFNNYEGHLKIATFIKQQLQKHLGIETSTQKMEWKSLLAKLHQGDYHWARGSWCADYPDPLTFLMVFHSEGENNYSKYNNPKYDELLKQIMAEGDRKKRNELLYKAEKMLIRDAPLLPIYHYTKVYMLKPYLKGFATHYMDYHLVKYMYWDPNWKTQH